MTLRHRLTAELEQRYRERTTERRCDCCGAASPSYAPALRLALKLLEGSR